MSTRARLVVASLLGGVALAAAVVLAVTNGPEPVSDMPDWLGWLLLLAVAGPVLWKLGRTPTDDGLAPAPWTDEGALVSDPPERTPTDDPVSGTALAEAIEAAAETAGDEGDVDAGVEAIREPLRTALVDALTQAGRDRATVEASLRAGDWTDDPVAAAVLDGSVTPPDRSLRRRTWAWLFPERALRYRVTRAAGAVAHVADDALPTVVGQRAPRPVPIAEPTLEDLQRAVDGTLQRTRETIESPTTRDGPSVDRADGASDDPGEDDWPGVES